MLFLSVLFLFFVNRIIAHLFPLRVSPFSEFNKNQLPPTQAQSLYSITACLIIFTIIFVLYLFSHFIVIGRSSVMCNVCGLIFLGRGTIWPFLVESLHVERHIMEQYVLVSFANCFFHNVVALHIQPHMYMFTLLDESH